SCQLLQAVDELIAYQARRREELQLQAEAVAAQSRRVMIVFTAVALLLGGFSAIVVTWSISRPARMVAGAADRLADGDLTVETLNVRSRDEIGDMARAFNRMVESLRSMMAAIGRASAELMENGRQLAAMAEESASATSQIVAAINHVAEGANQQASNSNETAVSAQHLRKA